MPLPTIDLVTLAEFQCPFCGLRARVALSEDGPVIAHELPYESCKFNTLDADEYVKQAVMAQRAANAAARKASN